MKAKNLSTAGVILLLLMILTQGCGPSEPEAINTDFKVEFKTRTFGSGVGYMIPNSGAINPDGTIKFSDLKVEDAVRACLCDYQKINCNGISSKVIIKSINNSLANYVFIDDQYKGKTKNQENIAQAIMLKMEEAGVISINERIKDVPRFFVEQVDEEKLKKHLKKRAPNFQDKTRCNANQTQRNNVPSSAEVRHISSTKKFLGDLSFCLGVDIFIEPSIQDNAILDETVLFDMEVTDDPQILAFQMKRYGLTIKKYFVKSKVLEINITPQMINLTKEGLRK